MYLPSHFKESDPQQLHDYIRRYGFGLLIVADEQGIEANHVPFYLNRAEDGSLGTLECHVARKNPVWQRVEQAASVLVVFQGPDAYVSPSWYATKAETGRVVPTWNYLAVHAEGVAKPVQDPAWLKQHLSRLTDQQESGRPDPWAVSDAPADFTDQLMQAIVGIEIRIETLTGKRKASQNQPERNREGVRKGLAEAGDPGVADAAKLIP